MQTIMVTLQTHLHYLQLPYTDSSSPKNVPAWAYTEGDREGQGVWGGGTGGC